MPVINTFGAMSARGFGLFGNTAPAPTPVYEITNSLRFRNAASAYLSRTPSVAGNRYTWTMSCWVKRGSMINCPILVATAGTSETSITFVSESLYIYSTDAFTDYIDLFLTPSYRDPASWYHLVVAFDTNNATDSDRVKIYINGNRVTSISPSANLFPSLGYQGSINNTISHTIGAYVGTQYADIYMSEMHFIDGQVVDPTSFGQFSSITGEWIPIPYTGSYGANGYYLNFSNTTSATTLGYDTAPIAGSHTTANNWTPTNISVASGVTYDSMLDTPTNNYPVINPLPFNPTIGAGIGNYLNDGNLTILAGSIAGTNTFSTFAIPPYGKWYCEATTTQYNVSTIVGWFGVNTMNPDNTYGSNFSGLLARAGVGTGGGYYEAGVNINGGYFGNVNDWFGIAVDRTTLPGTVTVYINNASPYTVDAPSGEIFFEISEYINGIGYVNFGQQPWHNAPPSGYVGLCTNNMNSSTIPAIKDGAKYFAATEYTGTGANQTITNTVNIAAFQPDFVWIKSINSSAYSHRLFDSIRGVNVNMQSDTTNGDTAEANSLTAFVSNGFSVGVDTVGGGVNTNAIDYISWQWKGSNTTVSNTNGSISSTVCANQTAGFSVVSYTGTGAAATVGHGLGIAPSFIVQKPRTGPSQWPIYHTSMGNTNALLLNSTVAQSSYPQMWNSTTPSSSVFSLGTDPTTNPTGLSCIAYCFAAIEGFSSFGTYTGNGNVDGPFAYCGFRPRWIMWKRTDDVGDWIIQDTTRSLYNAADDTLYPNLANAQASGGGYGLDILSNGFKPRNTAAYSNASSGIYIYAAFAERPFQYANAR